MKLHPLSRNRLCLTLFSALSALALAGPASAGVVYQTRVSSVCGDGFTVNDFSEVADEPSLLARSISGPGCSADTFGGAGQGFLALSGVSQSVADFEPRSYLSSATVVTSARFSEISITLPTSYAGGTIPVALALDLEAALSATVVDGTPANADASITASLSVSAFPSGPDIVVFSEEIFVNGTIGDGILPGAALGINAALITDFFEVDPTVPLVVTLGLSGSSSTTASTGSIANGSVRARNSLSFRESNPFILPEGFSVTYEDANIFDNTWVDPRMAPEPALPLGALVALLPLARLGRRNRDSS